MKAGLNRHLCPFTWRAANREYLAHAGGALAPAAQPEPRQVVHGHEAALVIVNLQMDSSLVTNQVEAKSSRLSMANCVGQRLLADVVPGILTRKASFETSPVELATIVTEPPSTSRLAHSRSAVRRSPAPGCSGRSTAMLRRVSSWLCRTSSLASSDC